MEQSLIDKDKLAESMVWRDDQGMISSIDDVLDTIDTAPTIDPESLRPKAHWIYDGKTDEDGNLVCRCSRCEHGDRHSPGITVPYCWFCGAKMEEKTDET